MFKTTALLAITRALLDALLGSLGTRPAAALLTTPKIELYTARTAQPSINSAYADFTFANFSGYANAALVLSGPVNPGPNSAALIANANFIATTASPFVPNTILGYAVTDGASVLYAAEEFTSPVPIASAGDFLDLNFLFILNSFERPS